MCISSHLSVSVWSEGQEHHRRLVLHFATCSCFTCRFRCPRVSTISFATLSSFRSGYGPVWMNYDAATSRIAICIIPVGSRCRSDGTWALCFQRINQFEYPQTPTAASGEHAQNCEICGLLSCHPLMPPIGPYVQLSLV